VDRLSFGAHPRVRGVETHGAGIISQIPPTFVEEPRFPGLVFIAGISGSLYNPYQGGHGNVAVLMLTQSLEHGTQCGIPPSREKKVHRMLSFSLMRRSDVCVGLWFLALLISSPPARAGDAVTLSYRSGKEEAGQVAREAGGRAPETEA